MTNRCENCACESIEQDMTDAGKATTRSFTVAIAADRMVGKTTLMLFLLNALADAGMLSAEATKRFTENPMRYIMVERLDNEEHVETISLDLDLEAAILDMINPQPRLFGRTEIDAVLTTLMRPRHIKSLLSEQISGMVDKCFEDHGRMESMTLTVDLI
jgi:hypothetical protein